MSTPAFIALQHGRIELALHCLRNVPGGWPLLLLHGLGEQSPTAVPLDVAGWNGSIYALDFTGHGSSTVPRGGGYTAEILMADADAALGHIGPATVLGRGLGGYVALLIAGARPQTVRGVIIDDGLGLLGGGATPTTNTVDFPTTGINDGAPDPYVFVEMSSDIRPGDYAATYARAAIAGSQNSVAIAAVTSSRPPWLAAVLENFGAEAMSLTDALDAFGGYPYA